MSQGHKQKFKAERKSNEARVGCSKPLIIRNASKNDYKIPRPIFQNGKDLKDCNQK